EFFRGEPVAEAPQDEEADRLRPVVVPAESPMRGRPLGDLPLEGIAITALVRGGQRHLEPPRDMAIEAGDVVVLFGSPDDLGKAERALFG
ncbi:MAG TPA: TrkA C-terminal domain-containing protein, partial [Usitatibacteraceae bacterium]|nr:TrkA C-terminal domain-containing protein [Usitatibacteraceae bacterium]